MNALIIENEQSLTRTLGRLLESEGYEVVIAHSGEEGFFLANEAVFDVVLLDVSLPGRGGLAVLRMLRRRGIGSPVILMSDSNAVEDTVAGLDTGADDYLVKPFAPAELLARIRAVTRRGWAEQALLLTCGDLTMDVITRIVTRGGRTISLTAREFDLLEYLMRHKGRAVSRDMLVRDIWQEDSRANNLDNVIDVHVARIRKKIDHGHSVKLLHTLRGVGFQLKNP
ncbi:response regulator [Pseudodesulfovibrio sp. F-1]|uniref:Response regulator n=1 Tax=Pseudodesulfovibrio alkaliphilus TaxID=2661613 RepID=A0A7K1KPS0_9BACT|nr:response regulator transcription factor [Pseudodesulfovibrio alkaliphilus]MUM78084.1 response regulator [Pseudodesulfovibrio alkaliphilus]